MSHYHKEIEAHNRRMQAYEERLKSNAKEDDDVAIALRAMAEEEEFNTLVAQTQKNLDNLIEGQAPGYKAFKEVADREENRRKAYLASLAADEELEEYRKEHSGEAYNEDEYQGLVNRVREAVKGIEVDLDAPEEQEYDNVEYPKHYNSHPSGIACIDITEHMNFCIGNAIKYLFRHEYKGGVEDLKKAKWYIEREIDRLKRVSQEEYNHD
jgi:hypothetical protein